MFKVKRHIPHTYPEHPLKSVQWVVLLGGALGRIFGGSPHFLFVFYRPDRREHSRSESRMLTACPQLTNEHREVVFVHKCSCFFSSKN